MVSGILPICLEKIEDELLTKFKVTHEQLDELRTGMRSKGQ
jgi:hypothetical protein